MKRNLVIGIISAILISLVIITIPAFAHGPSEDGKSTATGETWQAMYEACEEGDWQAMAEAAQEAHADLEYITCYDGEYLDQENSNSGGWGGMMGGYMHSGIMGW